MSVSSRCQSISLVRCSIWRARVCNRFRIRLLSESRLLFRLESLPMTTVSPRMKANDAEKLEEEYAKLLEGLQAAGDHNEEDDFMANPSESLTSPLTSSHPDDAHPVVLPADMLDEAVPGSIRRAEHFTAFLARFVEYLKTRMRVLHVVAETPLSFLQHLKDITFIERKPLKSVVGRLCRFWEMLMLRCRRFCSERLASLVRTLELTRIDEYASLQKVAAFATLVATYDKGQLSSSSRRATD